MLLVFMRIEIRATAVVMNVVSIVTHMIAMKYRKGFCL